MFEQAVLPSGSPGGRCWAVVIGVTGEVLLVACALIAPIIWPQFLPRPKLLTWLSLPAPPSPVKHAPPVHVRPVKPWQTGGEKLRQPVANPDKVAIIEDPPLAAPGVVASLSTTDLAGLTIGILDQPPHVAPPPRAADPQITQPPKPPDAKPVPRVKAGGVVNMARLVRRVDPIYPPLARQARISGTVELTGVIGVDGRIRELQVVKGHPLLARAALEAVRQWIYEPTLLNGKPVEVIAPITVNFVLG